MLDLSTLASNTLNIFDNLLSPLFVAFAAYMLVGEKATDFDFSVFKLFDPLTAHFIF